MFYCHMILVVTILLGSYCEVLAQNGYLKDQKAEPSTSKSSNPVGEKSLAKCHEYSKYATRMEQGPALVLPPRYVNVLDCAIDYENPISGVTKANHKEFPHVAQLGYMYEGKIIYACSGSLISENFILTAAHCLNTVGSGLPVKVRVGVTNQTDLNDAQIREVAELIKHPHYYGERTNSFENDIGLVRVNKAFELNPAVRPACIYTKKDISNETFIASLFIAQSMPQNSVLIKETVRFFSHEDCYHKYNTGGVSIPIEDESMICAGYNRNDSCEAHSGSPIHVFHDTTKGIECMYDIIGFATFGKRLCDHENTPTVHTRVSNYVEWIEGVVWRD